MAGSAIGSLTLAVHSPAHVGGAAREVVVARAAKPKVAVGQPQLPQGYRQLAAAGQFRPAPPTALVAARVRAAYMLVARAAEAAAACRWATACLSRALPPGDPVVQWQKAEGGRGGVAVAVVCFNTITAWLCVVFFNETTCEQQICTVSLAGQRSSSGLVCQSSRISHSRTERVEWERASSSLCTRLRDHASVSCLAELSTVESCVRSHPARDWNGECPPAELR